MKSLNLSKQEFLNLKKSYEWIDKHRFATLDMLPLELGKIWIDQQLIMPSVTKAPHSTLQRMIFLYGLYSTNNLLNEKTSKFLAAELESFYSKWQIKVALTLVFHQHPSAFDFDLDHSPLFLFDQQDHQINQNRWNDCIKTLFDLGIKNISA